MMETSNMTLSSIKIEEDLINSLLIDRRTSITIDTEGFEFVPTNLSISGYSAFEGQLNDVVADINSNTIAFYSNGNDINRTTRGAIILDGIQIKALDNATAGKVKLKFSGPALPDKYTVVVAEYTTQP